MLIVVQIVVIIFKILVFLSIYLLKIVCISFILRVWVMSIVRAIISWIFCSDFALLSLNNRLICNSKISAYHLLFWVAKMSIGMVWNVWVVKLSYWSFFYESIVITLIFKDVKIVCFFSMNLIAFKIWKILIILEIYAVYISLLLLMKAKMLDLFKLINLFIILELILIIIFSKKNILVLIMTWMKLMLKSLKMIVLIVLSSGNEFSFRWTYRIMMVLPVVVMMWNSIICYLLSINIIAVFLKIRFNILGSILFKAFMNDFILCTFFIDIWIILNNFCNICILLSCCAAPRASSGINFWIILHLLQICHELKLAFFRNICAPYWLAPNQWFIFFRLLKLRLH